MMAPAVVLRDGAVELVLGSAGSNRIRSAILQTIVGVVDRELSVADAVHAPRVHLEDGILYHEPGIEVEELASACEEPEGTGTGTGTGGASWCAFTHSISSSEGCRQSTVGMAGSPEPATPVGAGLRWMRDEPR